MMIGECSDHLGFKRSGAPSAAPGSSAHWTYAMVRRSSLRGSVGFAKHWIPNGSVFGRIVPVCPLILSTGVLLESLSTPMLCILYTQKEQVEEVGPSTFWSC